MKDWEDDGVDAVDDLGSVARAIKDGQGLGTDATGAVDAGSAHLPGFVGSATEALMGVTAGLVRIAESIDRLADAVAERDSDV